MFGRTNAFICTGIFLVVGCLSVEAQTTTSTEALPDGIPPGLEHHDPLIARRPEPNRQIFEFRDAKTGFVGQETINTANGKTVKRVLRKDDKLHGIQRTWYDNGAPKLAESYREGIMDGLFQVWDEDGQLVGNSLIRGGTGMLLVYYPNGRVQSQKLFVKNMQVGLALDFYSNGQLTEYQNWIENHIVGRGYGFWDNGMPRVSRAADEKGELNGPIVYFSDKGTFAVDRKNDFFIHGKLIPESTYILAAAKDSSLPAFHDDPKWYLQNMPAEISTTIKTYKEKNPVRIPLKADSPNVE